MIIVYFSSNLILRIYFLNKTSIHPATPIKEPQDKRKEGIQSIPIKFTLSSPTDLLPEWIWVLWGFICYDM